MPWETLFENGYFVALQPAWPIARIADPAGRLSDREFVTTPQLRVVAVLSALHQPAGDEWEALRDAAVAARQAAPSLDVKLTVLVGEPALRQRIAQEVAGGAGFVTVDTIPATDYQLRTRIENEMPHVLHLYCHGEVDGAVRRLRFATASEWVAAQEGQQGTGSLNIGIAALPLSVTTASTWLVVINACTGGTDTPEDYSLAGELARQGVPAAIGHRQSISPPDAHRFAGELYRSLFGLLAREFAAGGQREIEWAEVLYAPRSGLQARYGDPADSEFWSLPILHVGEMPFKVRIVPAGDAVAAADASRESGTTSTLTEALRTVATLDLPPAVVTDLLQPLDPVSAADLRNDM